MTETTIKTTTCGHKLHQTCYTNMRTARRNECGVCRQSFNDPMINQPVSQPSIILTSEPVATNVRRQDGSVTSHRTNIALGRYTSDQYDLRSYHDYLTNGSFHDIYSSNYRFISLYREFFDRTHPDLAATYDD
jgi:hypothetical protein